MSHQTDKVCEHSVISVFLWRERVLGPGLHWYYNYISKCFSDFRTIAINFIVLLNKIFCLRCVNVINFVLRVYVFRIVLIERPLVKGLPYSNIQFRWRWMALPLLLNYLHSVLILLKLVKFISKLRPRYKLSALLASKQWIIDGSLFVARTPGMSQIICLNEKTTLARAGHVTFYPSCQEQ